MKKSEKLILLNDIDSLIKYINSRKNITIGEIKQEIGRLREIVIKIDVEYNR